MPTIGQISQMMDSSPTMFGANCGGNTTSSSTSASASAVFPQSSPSSNGTAFSPQGVSDPISNNHSNRSHQNTNILLQNTASASAHSAQHLRAQIVPQNHPSNFAQFGQGSNITSNASSQRSAHSYHPIAGQTVQTLQPSHHHQFRGAVAAPNHRPHPMSRTMPTTIPSIQSMLAQFPQISQPMVTSAGAHPLSHPQSAPNYHGQAVNIVNTNAMNGSGGVNVNLNHTINLNHNVTHNINLNAACFNNMMPAQPVSMQYAVNLGGLNAMTLGNVLSHRSANSNHHNHEVSFHGLYTFHTLYIVM